MAVIMYGFEEPQTLKANRRPARPHRRIRLTTANWTPRSERTSKRQSPDRFDGSLHTLQRTDRVW